MSWRSSWWDTHRVLNEEAEAQGAIAVEAKAASRSKFRLASLLAGIDLTSIDAREKFLAALFEHLDEVPIGSSLVINVTDDVDPHWIAVAIAALSPRFDLWLNLRQGPRNISNVREADPVWVARICHKFRKDDAT